MKIGVKIFCDKEFAEYFEDKADFLEVMAIPGKDYSFLEEYKLPIVIHAQHIGFGVNFADSDLIEKSRESTEFAIELAEKLGSEKVILHPGNYVNDKCSLSNAVESIKELDDRVIIENCVPRDKSIATSPDEMTKILENTSKRFIFDFNHAIESAEVLGFDYNDFVDGFLALNPVHFHLGGQKFGEGALHLFFDESDIPVEDLLKKLPEDAWITLETGTDIEGVEKDLEFIRGLVG